MPCGCDLGSRTAGSTGVPGFACCKELHNRAPHGLALPLLPTRPERIYSHPGGDRYIRVVTMMGTCRWESSRGPPGWDAGPEIEPCTAIPGITFSPLVGCAASRWVPRRATSDEGLLAHAVVDVERSSRSPLLAAVDGPISSSLQGLSAGGGTLCGTEQREVVASRSPLS